MKQLLFKFELKKLLSQTSTKVILLILMLFPVIIVFGIISPTPQFSITMDNFNSAADFSNAMLGFLNSVGFYYIVLVVLTASSLSKEIEGKYIYFVLSAIPNAKRLFIYKVISITIIFVGMLLLSSATAYIAYSTLYLKSFSFTLQNLGVMSWGLGISVILTMMYAMILTIVNLVTNGSVFASLTTAIATIILLIILSAVKGAMHFVPSWALDYLPERNNLLLLGVYFALMAIIYLVMRWTIDRENL